MHCHSTPLQTVAAYFCLHWVIINKLQGKAVTHGEKLEWWIILMVDCVTILLHFSTIRFPSANRYGHTKVNTKVNDHTRILIHLSRKIYFRYILDTM